MATRRLTLEQLQEQHRKLLLKTQDSARQIEEYKAKQARPALSKKYIGKWFRQLDRGSDIHEVILSKVSAVSGYRDFLVDQIILSYDGKTLRGVRFESGKSEFQSTLGHYINDGIVKTMLEEVDSFVNKVRT